MPNLLLLRHGESQWNLENRFTGWVDIPLSPKGEKEAREAGEIPVQSTHEPQRRARAVQFRHRQERKPAGV